MKTINVRISKEDIEQAYNTLKNGGEGFIFKDVEHITKKEMKSINKEIKHYTRF